MKIIPRHYQREGTLKTFEYFHYNKTGNPVIAMPTGTGKSIVIADFLNQIYTYYANQKIMVLTHVKELIVQNYNKLINLWPEAPAGIYSAGLKQRDLHSMITFAGIGSVSKKASSFGHIDLIIIDEAHLVSPKDTTMYRKFISAATLINPNLRVIGLTATPWRLGHGMITEGDSIFTDICFDITGFEAFNRLLDEGFLCPLIPKKTQTTLDLDNVHIRGGEFVQKELQQAVDKEQVTRNALKETLDIASDRSSWLVFASGISHAVHISDILNQYGIDSGVVHGGNKEFKMTNNERDKNIADFKAGKLQALVNNNVLTTGFDYPGIDLIVMLRPTMSPGLWVQMLGRGTRPIYEDGYDLNTIDGRLQAIANSHKKDCLVLDYAGNTSRLGPINDPVIPKKKKGKGGGTAPVKVCEKCDTINHASVKYCVSCDFEFHVQVKIKMEASTKEIIKKKEPPPIVEEFNVDHITYSIHHKRDRPPTLKVSYYCGYHMFTEYVCLEHRGGARKNAERWWNKRSNFETPETSQEALSYTDQLLVPSTLMVWVNKRYPEIINHIFNTEDTKEDNNLQSLQA